MSYAGVRAFGAGAAQQCNGLEVTDDGLGNMGDSCCPSSTWSSVTYRAVKGSDSWQYWLARRIESALALLLHKSDMGLATNIHQFAYDKGLSPETAVTRTLVDRIKKAQTNFAIIYPKGRWSAVQNATPGLWNGGECGPYDVWRMGSGVASSSRARIMSEVSPAPVTAVQIATGNLPQGYRNWDFAMRRHWETMPTAGAKEYGSQKRVPAPSELLTISGGKVYPTPWFQQFLNLIAPFATTTTTIGDRTIGISQGPTQKGTPGQRDFEVKKPTIGITQMPRGEVQVGTRPSGNSSSLWLIAAGAVVVVGGAAYFAWGR